MDVLLNNSKNDAKKIQNNMEKKYNEKSKKFSDNEKEKKNIYNEELNINKELLLNELYNLKNNLFDYYPFSNYIHFYEVYNNLKYIVKYERKQKGNLFFIYTNRKRNLFFLVYLFFLFLNIFLLFRLQTLIKIPIGYNNYFFYEINFHVFFTFYVLTYSILNIYMLFCSYKILIHHINVMCIIIIQSLYNTYIKEKNKEIYRNTEILIEGCKKLFYNLDNNFDNIILLYADNVFNKFTNIFKYINKENCEYEDVYTNQSYETYIKEKDIPNMFKGIYSDESNNIYKKNEKIMNKKYSTVINIRNEDFYKKLNYTTNEKMNKYSNDNRKSIYNIYGNSIYSNIYDINVHMKYKYNYIHSLMLQKCQTKINYIKFFFYFSPYLINLFINLILNFYVLISVYYYNNIIPLASSFELSKLHLLNIFNYKGIYYILFIFLINFFFFMYTLFLCKLNTIYFFLRQIYTLCKYESIYYCDHIMNEIYENFIFSEIVKDIFDSKNKGILHIEDNEKMTCSQNLQKKIASTENIHEQKRCEDDNQNVHYSNNSSKLHNDKNKNNKINEHENLSNVTNFENVYKNNSFKNESTIIKHKMNNFEKYFSIN
ncbi:conserved Plasmodium protein, unknown function [Plasmodium gallinaceum]|uniref:Uncharacterized protein n=1 Tax=Plasmodium gallinaceum TaxID=5849 RepID=A0A1J1GWK0_PLAGA|nr:conserved Plasmodium protein, unknown function [Plasmodium gallinaceum]CRG96639.1 conserved Plasmodium protein, unknown function [Plasmodium gallinaceum]